MHCADAAFTTLCFVCVLASVFLLFSTLLLCFCFGVFPSPDRRGRKRRASNLCVCTCCITVVVVVVGFGEKGREKKGTKKSEASSHLLLSYLLFFSAFIAFASTIHVYVCAEIGSCFFFPQFYDDDFFLPLIAFFYCLFSFFIDFLSNVKREQKKNLINTF